MHFTLIRVACPVCHGIEAALVRFLDKRIQIDPDLVSRDLTIPLFEVALVQAASEKEPDGVV